MCLIFIIYFHFMESDSHWTAQADFELEILLPLPFKNPIIPQATDSSVAVALFQLVEVGT